MQTLLRRRWPLVAALAVYLVLAGRRLDFPGLNLDEAADGVVAEYILRPPVPDARIMTFSYAPYGRVLPVMAGKYTGALNDYVAYPFVRWLGPTTAALRLPMVLLGALTIFLLYGAAEPVFGARAAGLTAVLLAADLSFVQYSRIGLAREELPLVCLMAAVFFCLSRRRWLAAAFLLGLGLSAKITFVWYLAALVAACAAVRPNGVRLSRSQWALCAALFLAGAAPLIAYNLSGPRSGSTLRLVVASLFRTSPVESLDPGVHNLSYLSNLAGARLPQLFRFLRGELVDSVAWGVALPSALQSLQMVCAFLVLACFGYLGYACANRRAVRWAAVFYLAVFLQTPFTVSNLSLGHLAMLLPLPQLAVALAAEALWHRIGGRKGAALAGLLVLPFLGAGAWANADYAAQMAGDGGSGRWTASVVELEAYLAERGADKPAVFGYGLQEDLLYLSGYRIVAGMADTPEAARRLYASRAKDRPAYGVWSGTDFESRPALDAWLASGRKGVLDRTFVNLGGKTVYWVYRIDPR